MSVYADTSFLVSLYTPDANSLPAAKLMQHAPLPVALTLLGELEFTNALQLRLFRKELAAYEIKAAMSLFRKDLEAGIFFIKSMPASIYERAKQVSRRRTSFMGTRTLDILHVASALVLQTDTFYTFDNNQRKLAKAEGLGVS